MIALGIDPSTHTGLAVVDSSKKVLYENEVEFKKASGSERASLIAGAVFEAIDLYKPDIVTIESMFVGHTSSASILIEIGSVLRFFLWQEHIKYLDIPAGTLKKFVSGKGNAKKDEIMMHVLKNWGHTSKTNNTADAVGLAMCGLCWLGGKFSKPQQEISKSFVVKP